MAHKFTKAESRRGAYAAAATKNSRREIKLALRELLLEELAQPIEPGSDITKAEYLTAKMIENTSKNITPGDFLLLQRILGETPADTAAAADGLTPSERIAMFLNGRL